MSKAGAFLAGFVVASAAATGVWWFALRPKLADGERRAVEAERIAARANRDASAYQESADAERRRKLDLEDEVATLKKLMTAAPPKRPASADHTMPAAEPGKPAPDAKSPAPSDDSPESWDGRRMRMEIEWLAEHPAQIVDNPRYPLVVRALKAHGDEGISLMKTVLQPETGMETEMRSVCAVLLGALDDRRGVVPLMEAWRSAKDDLLRHSILRGLANIPGDEPTPILTQVWNDPASDIQSLRLVIHGLARRRNDIALKAAADGVAGGTRPLLRYQALTTLHAQALRGEWKELSLVPVFGKALRTADGDQQRKLALLALEGFWSKDCLADVDAFAAASANADLAARARALAADLRAGKPRPESAGLPPQAAGAVPGEPSDAPDPKAGDGKDAPK